MKKIGNKIKQNAKTITAFVLGAILTGGTVYAATVLPSSQVGYDNSTSGLAATDVQGALDELNTKANTWIDPSTIQTNSTGTVFASLKGIIIRRNGETHFFKVDNFAYEKDHIQQVFSDGTCDVSSTYVDCSASDFVCGVNQGKVYCRSESSDGPYCQTNYPSDRYPNGRVYCN